MGELRTSMSDQGRLAIAWWTIVTWAAYVAAFPTLLLFWIPPSGLHIAWFGLALAGLVGGVMALRNVRGWRSLLYIAYALVIAWSIYYWAGIIDKILVHEEEKTLAKAFSRIWLMVTMSFSAAARDGGMFGTISTWYREIAMPVLQVGAVLVIGIYAFSRRPNAA
jgi:hypothetical protein